MAKLWAVIKREFMERVRTKWFIITTVFGPVFFGVIMVLPAYLSVRGMRDVKVADIRILDATGTGLGNRVAVRLNGGPMGDAAATQVLILEPGALVAAESAATKAVMANERRGYLVLDSLTLSSQKARYAGRCVPCAVCVTSGWNWTPWSDSFGWRTAANGVFGEVAVVSNPTPGLTTLSPWLIQTSKCGPSPRKSPSVVATSMRARPNSRFSTRFTSPPSRCAISCMP